MKQLSLILLLLLGSCTSAPPAPVVQPQVETPLKVAISEEEKREDNVQEVMVYYRHPTIEGVLPLKRKIFKLKNPGDMVKQVIEQLTIQPDEHEGMAIWPENTYVRELYLLSDGTVVIDFHDDFVASLSAGSTTEAFLVYSLVYSVLDNFPKYHAVHILVDGEVRESFLGHIDIEFPIPRNHHLYTIVPEVRDQDLIPSEELPPPDFINEGLN